MHLSELKAQHVSELIKMREALEIENVSRMRKQELMFAIMKKRAKAGEQVFGDGVLEVLPDGFGFLRSPDTSYMASTDELYLTVRGKGGHGAMPHVAVDPIVVASHLVLALQTIRSREIDPNDMAVVTIGAIHAGDAPNVIPETCELRVTIRARCPEVRQQLRERITAILA